MAQESPALMEALLGLSAVQMALAQGEQDMPTVKASMYYQKSLGIHFRYLQDHEALTSDAPLATSIVLSHFEVCLLLF